MQIRQNRVVSQSIRKIFESKEQIVQLLDDYNSKMEREGKDEQVISYTDMVGTHDVLGDGYC